jgi:uncharacterized membrane protein YedE/YeeE
MFGGVAKRRLMLIAVLIAILIGTVAMAFAAYWAAHTSHKPVPVPTINVRSV